MAELLVTIPSYVYIFGWIQSRCWQGGIAEIILLRPCHSEGGSQNSVHSLRVGWRNFFSSCVVVSIFVLAGNRFWFYILLMYLEYNAVVVLYKFFWFWREIVFGVMYVLSVQYSCASVSVFFLWREIVFKMRTRFHKKILLGYFIMIRKPMCVFYKT